MLGEYALEGIEAIESAERRALVEHRVPGMEGSYLQDLGSAPNAILIAGTRYGDEARDSFLEQVRALFGSGEPTTFTADINTATDLTDVVIDDLHVAEVAGEPDTFRYVLRLRKYVEPPAPAAAGLPAIDDDLLGAAGDLVGALDTLDALLSTPDLGDPTPPLRESLGGVRDATSGLPPATADAEARLGGAVEGTGTVPAPDELSGTLEGVEGSAEEGTGVAGALGVIARTDLQGQRTDLIARLDGTLAQALPVEGQTTGGPALEQIGAAAGALPEPEALAAPLAQPLQTIAEITGPEAAGALPEATAALAAVAETLTQDPDSLLAEAIKAVRRFQGTLADQSSGALGGWSTAVADLAAALQAPGVEVPRDRLIAFLRDNATALADGLVSGGGPLVQLERALEAAASPEHLGALRGAADDLAASVARIRAEAEAGGVPSGEHFSTAEEAMRRTSAGAVELVDRLAVALRLPAASEQAHADALRGVHAGLADVELVELGNLADALGGVLQDLSGPIAAIDLDALVAEGQAPLRAASDAVGELGLGRLTEGLDEAQAAASEALAGLDGAVLEVMAAIGAAFGAARDALGAATSAVGTVGDDGRFHFHAEQELQQLLTGVHDTISRDIGPALDEFRATFGEAVGEVTAALEGVTAEIEGAKQQLAEALQQVAAQLEEVDVTGVARGLAEQLGQAFDALLQVDLDVVVDPVVAAIEGMRDELRAIDPDSLNDVLRAALAVATALLRAVDFPGEITAVLMTELDELLAQPLGAIDGLQGRLDAAVEQFAQLDPAILVAPLAGLFEPVTAALDGLDPQALVGPLTDWYAAARAALESVMPETLLAPLVAAHDELRRVVTSISADAVASLIEEQLARASAELDRLQPAALVGGLSEEHGRVRALVESLSHEAVVATLSAVHAEVAEQLRALDPTALLEPLRDLTGALDAALAEVTDADAQTAADALGPLRALVRACDPQQAFPAAVAAIAAVTDGLAALELETRLAQVRADGAATLAGLTDEAARVRVEALDPLVDPALTLALADLGRLRAALRSAYPSGEPPATLITSYEQTRAVVEALVPPWAQGTPSSEALRGAFAWADPATVTQGLTDAQAAVVAAWNALDPVRAAEPIAEIQAQVLDALAAVDPRAIAARVDALVGGLATRLQELDLTAIREQGRELSAEVTGLVDALDPRPTIAQLTTLADDVRGLVERLDPAALLAEFQEPLEAAKRVVAAVDPAALAEALEPAFAGIREILEGVDLREALEPLLDRLDGLRAELESALGRTERAFRELLAAIPS